MTHKSEHIETNKSLNENDLLLSKNKLAVFDVCGTLYNSNTTFDFLDYCFKKKFIYKIFRSVVKTLLVRGANYFLYRALGTDFIRILATRFIKGHTVSELSSLSDSFLYDYLIHKERSNIVYLMDAFHSRGYTIILMSASYLFLVEKIASYFNISNYYASELEIKNDHYTGRYSCDIYARKKSVLLSHFRCIDFLIVVTDSKSDLDLLGIADKAYLVCTKQKDVLYWNNLKMRNFNVIMQAP